LENEHWDAERVRKDEADLVRVGRTMQVTVARAASGGLAGHTQLAFPDDDAEVYQWDTLVRPEHRGHGLGLALKIHTMNASADLLAGRRRITTENAADNTHMIAVNEQLGFRQTAWTGEYVRDI
ncbi:MAG: GNAT family N-acetyltransferase, partial [Aeromicrobium sp.]